jgi:hypothetical protein
MIPVCVFFLFGCTFKTPRACPTSEMPFLHFSSQSPIQLDYTDVPAQYRQCIENSMLAWNETTKTRIFDFGSKIGSKWKVEWYFQRPEGFKPVWQGMSTLNSIDEVIDGARIRINNFDFKISEGEPNYNEVDCESLMIHELGHAIGIAHIDKTVMNPTLPSGMTRREITKPVVDAFTCIYGPEK